jgi:hopanoid-associated phosphorylase
MFNEPFLCQFHRIRRITKAKGNGMRIGIVVGMQSEAALLPSGAMIACSGGRPAKAEECAQYLLKAGAEGLISFGVAGGLDPALAPGDLVIGTSVDLGGASLKADEAWAKRLAGVLPKARAGIVCGAQDAALTAAAKASLQAESGGLTIDLESAAVAEACAAAGKPFAVLRAVADPADRAIPEFALKGLTEDGRTHALPVILGLLGRPWQLPALLGLARDNRAALHSLGAAARLLDASLGF